MTEAEKRMHRCCFTGHRPEKLAMSERQTVKELETAIRQAIADGSTYSLAGWLPALTFGLRRLFSD